MAAAPGFPVDAVQSADRNPELSPVQKEKKRWRQIMVYAEALLQDESLDARVVALETLHETLLFADPDVLPAVFKVDYLARRLPALVSAKGGDRSDVPLLAARAIAEAVDVMPQWAEDFAEHGAIQALRDRLIPLDNVVELAEECLLALRAICVECPDECLLLGVAAAVLRSSHLFSTSKQVSFSLPL